MRAGRAPRPAEAMNYTRRALTPSLRRLLKKRQQNGALNGQFAAIDVRLLCSGNGGTRVPQPRGGTAPPLARAAQEPAKWTQVTHPSGQRYFWNESTNETTALGETPEQYLAIQRELQAAEGSGGGAVRFLGGLAVFGAGMIGAQVLARSFLG